MKRFRPIALLALLILVMSGLAKADIIVYSINPGSFHPDENLLFNADLVSTGITIQGQTNQTGTIISITGNEILKGSGGQARVTALDGNFMWALFDAGDLYFTEFLANVNVYGTPVIHVTAIDRFGAPQSFQYEGGNGENFFGVGAVDGFLLDTIEISTLPNQSIEDIRQIRLGGITDGIITSGGVTRAPEPATLRLRGTGLGLMGLGALRKRK